MLERINILRREEQEISTTLYLAKKQLQSPSKLKPENKEEDIEGLLWKQTNDIVSEIDRLSKHRQDLAVEVQILDDQRLKLINELDYLTQQHQNISVQLDQFPSFLPSLEASSVREESDADVFIDLSQTLANQKLEFDRQKQEREYELINLEEKLRTTAQELYAYEVKLDQIHAEIDNEQRRSQEEKLSMERTLAQLKLEIEQSKEMNTANRINNKELIEMESQLCSKTKELEEVMDRLQLITKEVYEYECQRNQLNSELDDMWVMRREEEEVLQSRKELIETQEEEIRQKERGLKELETKTKTLRDSIYQYETQLGEIKEAYEDENKKQQNLENEIKSLETKYMQLQSYCAAKTQESDQEVLLLKLQEKCKNLEIALDQGNQQIFEYDQRKENLIREIQSADQELDEKRLIIVKLNNEIEKLELSKIHIYNASDTESGNERNGIKFQRRTARLKKRKNTTIPKMNNSTQTIEDEDNKEHIKSSPSKEYLEAQQQLNQIQLQKESIEMEITEKLQRLNYLHSKEQEQIQSNTMLSEQQETMQQNIIRIEDEMTTFQSQVDNLREEIKTLRTKRNQICTDKEQLLNEWSKLERQKEDTEEKLEELNRTTLQRQEQLESIEREISITTDKLVRLQAEIEDASNQRRPSVNSLVGSPWPNLNSTPASVRRIEEMETHKRHLEFEIEFLQKKKDDVLQQMEYQNHMTPNENENHDMNLKSYKEEMVTQIDVLEKRAQQATQELNILEASLRRSHKLYEKLRKKIGLIENEITNKEEYLKALLEDANRTKTEKALVIKEMETLMKSMKKEEERVQSLVIDCQRQAEKVDRRTKERVLSYQEQEAKLLDRIETLRSEEASIKSNIHHVDNLSEIKKHKPPIERSRSKSRGNAAGNIRTPSPTTTSTTPPNNINTPLPLEVPGAWRTALLAASTVVTSTPQQGETTHRHYHYLHTSAVR
eukprot:NODE_158_length_3419_cov_39.839806_g136_i0.p1 GENE.NODE_158_length_3419_cov_39.839806_g136_i0~~NODE_158_length_3419_cov_39.839806_g136_i0.p1  ORF type:complete len:1118 (-),score=278.70 NODE_158_length_3419_cov_39.839806_g136_i0:66-2921(-)